MGVHSDALLHLTVMKKKHYSWWHGLAFYAGLQLVQWALHGVARRTAGRSQAETRIGNRDLYEAERLPVFAPPGVAFPVAWGINSICLVAGGLHVLNLPIETKGRREFLRSQAAAWALFVLFEPAYFGLRSPINAAIITLLYSAATGVSLYSAWRQMRDHRATLSLGTTVVWLALANPVGATQALWNRDSFWGIGPLAQPPNGWAKEPKQLNE